VVGTGVDPVTSRFSGRIWPHVETVGWRWQMDERPVQRLESENPFALVAPCYCALFRIHKGTPRARNLMKPRYCSTDPAGFRTIRKMPATDTSAGKRDVISKRLDALSQAKVELLAELPAVQL